MASVKRFWETASVASDTYADRTRHGADYEGSPGLINLTGGGRDMWVKTSRDELKRLKDPEMDSALVLSSKNTAQCSEEIGEHLIETYPSFSRLDDEADELDEDAEDVDDDVEAADEAQQADEYRTKTY